MQTHTVCEKPFRAGQLRARDHCHLTGVYKGAAHQQCNLQYQDSLKIPVMFHNLSGYDAHLLIQELAAGIPGHTWFVYEWKQQQQINLSTLN